MAQAPAHRYAARSEIDGRVAEKTTVPCASGWLSASSAGEIPRLKDSRFCFVDDLGHHRRDFALWQTDGGNTKQHLQGKI